MNTKMKWTQLIGVAVLVALASVFVTGPVAADTPPVGADPIKQARRVQYREAVKQVERDHDWERFVQYTSAHESVVAAPSTSAPTSSLDKQAFIDQHLAWIEPVEQTHNEYTVSSGEYFDPYLWFTTQSGSAHNAAPVSTYRTVEVYRAALKQVEQDHDWDRFMQVLEGAR